MEMIQEKKMTDEYLERLKKKIDSLDDIVIVNGKEVARFPSKYRTVPYVVDELTGILKGDYDLDEVKEKYLREKYGLVH